MTRSSKAPHTFEPVEELALDSWDDFKTSFLKKIRISQSSRWQQQAEPTARPTFVFRGQACASWSLWSSFDRLMETQRVTGSDVERIYLHMLRHFLVQGTEMNLVPHPLQLSPDVEIAEHFKANPKIMSAAESFAQTHGVPTRLLDWSLSPYVAAFFALSEPEKCESKKAAIWALDVQGTRELFQDLDIVVLDRLPDQAQRVIWQRGVFTTNRTNLTRTDEVFLRKNGKLRGEPKFPVLFKFTLPLECAVDALHDLDMMRINFMSVYPDLPGLVRHTTHQLRHKITSVAKSAK